MFIFPRKFVENSNFAKWVLRTNLHEKKISFWKFKAELVILMGILIRSEFFSTKWRLRWISKLMFARWRSYIISKRLSERQPITERLQSISLESHLICMLASVCWNLPKLKKEYNRLSKIDYFVIPLFLGWCILFLTMPPIQESFQGQDAKEAYLKQTVSIVNNTKYIYETIVDQQFVTVWGNKTIPGSGLNHLFLHF